MRDLYIDIETYSSVSLPDCGLHKYMESPDFEILLVSYAFDDEPVRCIDIALGEEIPAELLFALTDTETVKHAWNAAFEYTAFQKYYKGIDTAQWVDDMVVSLYHGFPASLGDAGKALGLPQDKQKDARGKRLIRLFSIPDKKKGRIMPKDKLEEWMEYKEYNIRDVETEREISNRVCGYGAFPVPSFIWDEWRIDRRINDTGVRLDMGLVRGALAISEEETTALKSRVKDITGLDNPNSVAQLKAWIEEKTGTAPESLDKTAVSELLSGDLPEEVREVLEIRQKLGKSSIAKYSAMVDCECADGRARGLFQFYGANHTGRWCLTGEHEVLTPKGWVRIDEWTGGEIACWNPTAEAVSFQKSKALCFDYSGPVYHYEDTRISQISTPEHKMCVRKSRDKEWTRDTVENMAKYSPCIPFTGRRQTMTSLEHNELRVLVMTQADGCYHEDGHISYHFKKQRKIERCKHLLRRAGIYFTVSESEKDGTTHIKVAAREQPMYLRMFRDKTFGMWLLDENPDVFFEELVHWDGYQSAKNSIQYVTCNKQNADVVQAFAHTSGRCAKMKVKVRGDEHPNWSDAYILDIWLTPKNCHEIRNKPTITDYTGKVYCAETKTGYFLVRRDGKVWVTGNCGKNVQLQNLPRNYIESIGYARELVQAEDKDSLEMMYGDVQDTLSQLLRTALIPSDGNEFVIADYSAIECRVLAWLAGEESTLDAFRNGEDIYCHTASRMYGVPVVKHGENGELRQKGKQATLACGYGGGVNALRAMGAKGTDAELQPLVDYWRRANPNVVKYWAEVERAAKFAMRTAQPSYAKHVTFRYETDDESGLRFLTCELPSGRKLFYCNPRFKTNRFGGTSIAYDAQRTAGWGETETYGGKLVENCVAEGTKVITERGLVPIENVTSADRVWDGVEWVAHEGLISKGEQEVVCVSTDGIGGIYLTPEHKILTSKGWIENEKANGYDWADVPLPHDFASGAGHEGREAPVGLQMCLWEGDNCSTKRFETEKISDEIVRVHVESTDFRGKQDTRDVETSSVGGLAFNETEMHGQKPQSLSQLRWTRDNGMRTVDGEFREFLGGHGRDVSEWAGYRQDRQQQGVQQRKLPVGNPQGEQPKPEDKQVCKYGIRADYRSRVIRKDWNRGDNVALQACGGMAGKISIIKTGLSKRVYDIRNCGERHRFAVWDESAGRARIVSNCTQAVARDLLMNALKNIEDAGYTVVSHVHDEVIVDAPKGSLTVDALGGLMCKLPEWADASLPLEAAGFVSDYYMKD